MTQISAAAFYIMSLVAILAAALAITRRNAIHALMFMVLMFLALGGVFHALGAPFAAAIQVIIYAGAIMVLFVFAIMVIGPPSEQAPAGWRRVGELAAAGALTIALVAALSYASAESGGTVTGEVVSTESIAETLFGVYAVGVELASMLLLAGLVGAYHLGRRPDAGPEREEETA